MNVLWEVGSKHPVSINIEKAWNHTFAYSPYRGSGKPFRKNKQATPTPNMKCHQTEQSTAWTLCGGIVISQRAFTAFLFRAIVKFTRFRYAKTSANKRFLSYVLLFYVGERRYVYSQCECVFALRLQSYYIFLNCARVV